MDFQGIVFLSFTFSFINLISSSVYFFTGSFKVLTSSSFSISSGQCKPSFEFFLLFLSSSSSFSSSSKMFGKHPLSWKNLYERVFSLDIFVNKSNLKAGSDVFLSGILFILCFVIIKTQEQSWDPNCHHQDDWNKFRS